MPKSVLVRARQLFRRRKFSQVIRLLESQIFRYRNNAWAMQFHVEVRADTIMQWGEVPEYRAALENSLGAEALTGFDQAAREHMAEMNRLAGLTSRNFNQLFSA